MGNHPSTTEAPRAVVAHKRRVGLVVLGMHRSGTSAFTRVANLLGCELPTHLMPGGIGNIDGHWESSALADFNDELLTSAGTRWDDWLPFNAGWYASPVRADYEVRAAEMLKQEFGDSPLFVIKDPRICRIVPFWLNVLASEHVEVAVALPVRNPLEVAGSLQKRDGIGLRYGHLLWLRHILDAEMATRGRKRIFCSYDQLMTSWQIVAGRMQEKLGISWPRSSVAVEEDVALFLTKGHRHHEVPVEVALGDPTLSKWVRRTFEVMVKWTQGDEDPADYQDLDAIRRAFDEAAPAFGHVVLEAVRTRGKLEDLRRDVDASQHAWAVERNAFSAMIADLTAGNTALSNSKFSLESALRQREEEALQAWAGLKAEQGQVAELKAHISALDAGLLEKSSELAQYMSEISVLARSLKQKDEALARLTEERDSAQIDIKDLRSEIASIVSEQNIVQERLAERFREIATLSQFLRQQELRNGEQIRQADWLRRVNEVLWSLPRWWNFLPCPWQKVKTYQRLKRRGLFDAESYLARYPDVAQNRGDPLKHYIYHGMAEGRVI